MGRVLILVLIVVAIYLVWKAYGPQTWNRTPQAPEIKGPDDDEEFLWELEKKHFKEMRARQEAEEAERERRRREGKER